MGLFDNIEVDYPLPMDSSTVYEWQSKDTPQQTLDVYRLDNSGQLWHEDYDIEIVPEEERDRYGFPVMRRKNFQEEKCNITGEIEFHGIDERKNFHSYLLKLENGKVSELKTLEHPDLPH